MIARHTKKGTIATANTSLTPRRGGIFTCWSKTLGTATNKQDNVEKHWHCIDITSRSGTTTRLINLYNNNTTTLSDHPYDCQAGDVIIRYQISRLVKTSEIEATIVAGDFNLTENDTTQRKPEKKNHRKNGLNQLIKERNLLSTTATLETPAMTFEGSAGSSAIDNILISDRSIIRDAQVVQTIRMMDTHTPNAELTEYDSKTPHNMVIAYVNLHTLPEHILLIPADKPPTVPKQPRTSEEEDTFNKAFTQKLQNDGRLAHAIQTDEFRRKIEMRTQKGQVALLEEQMKTQKPNEGDDSSTLVAHYGALYRETLIELFGEKTHYQTKLRTEPNHPDIYRARAAQHAALEIVKLARKAPNAQTISLEVKTAITKLTERLRELSTQLKKPVDVWLDPTAPTLSSFLTSADRGKTPKKLETLIASVKYTNNKLANTIKSGRLLVQQKRDSKKIEAELDNPSSTSKSVWKKTAKLIKKNEGVQRQNDMPVQLYNGDGKPLGPPIINTAEQIKAVEECWTRISTPTCYVPPYLPNNTDKTPWAKYPSKPPSAEVAKEVSTLITYLEYNKARERLAPNKAPGTDHQLSNQKKRTCRR